MTTFYLAITLLVLCWLLRYRLLLMEPIFNEAVDPVLDKFISDRINADVKSVSADYYHATVEFADGTTFRFWNVNRCYAWMYEGVITYADGKKYPFYNCRPRAKTMYLFKKKLSKLSL